MNPILIKALPYLLCAALGFGAAWWIQGLRVTAEAQRLTRYVQGAVALTQQAEAKNQQVNQEVSDGWAKNLVALRERYAARRVLPAAACPAAGVSSSAGGADGAAAESAPGAAGAAPEVSEAACAQDALQVLYLQHWARRVGRGDSGDGK